MAESNSRVEPLILASGSPRRQQYLKDFGIAFEIDPADIDETPRGGELPLPYVRRLAEEKAREVASRHKGKVILAGDTTVARGRRIYGKPETREEAYEMIKAFAGRRHKVMSGVCVLDKEGNATVKHTVTVVQFKPMRHKDIEAYVANEENWRGVAGAYKIQGTHGGALVKSANGSISGVVGLPLVETINALKTIGYDL